MPCATDASRSTQRRWSPAAVACGPIRTDRLRDERFLAGFCPTAHPTTADVEEFEEPAARPALQLRDPLTLRRDHPRPARCCAPTAQPPTAHRPKLRARPQPCPTLTTDQADPDRPADYWMRPRAGLPSWPGPWPNRYVLRPGPTRSFSPPPNIPADLTASRWVSNCRAGQYAVLYGQGTFMRTMLRAGDQ